MKKKEPIPYSYPSEEDSDVLAVQEPVASYATEAVAIPSDIPYAKIDHGVLQVTQDIEDEIAAVDGGDTVSMNEFLTQFSRWVSK